MATNPELTAKQRRFVKEYCLDFNGTKAAIAAGYSKKTARQIGSENLTKPAIQGAIKSEVATLDVEKEISREQLIQDLAQIKDEHKSKTPYAAIRAIEAIAKLKGWYDPILNMPEDRKIVVRWANSQEEVDANSY